MAGGDPAQKLAVALGRQRAEKIPAAQLVGADATAVQALGHRLARLLGVVIDDRHTQRVVDQHGGIRESRALQRKRNLGDHQQQHPENRKPQRRQHDPIAAGNAGTLPPIDHRHENHRRAASSSVTQGGQGHAESIDQTVPSPLPVLIPSRRSTQAGTTWFMDSG